MSFKTLGCVLLFSAAIFGWHASGDHPKESSKGDVAPVQAKKHAVQIRTPSGPPSVKTGQTTPHGDPVTIRCATCHAGRTPNITLATGEGLRTFHQGLKFKHGNLTCVTCHSSGDYDQLRLADNRPLPYPRVMELCGQCHGPQARDYAHGAHGGMSGHWDLTVGERKRNNCIDCHDPHAPAFPQVRPVFAPKDRFPANHRKDER